MLGVLKDDLRLPPKVASRILEAAGYWVRSVGHRGQLRVSAFDEIIQEQLCCAIAIPPFVKGRKLLRRVVMTIRSRDQGAYQAEGQSVFLFTVTGLSRGTVSSRLHAGSPLQACVVRARANMIFADRGAL